MTRMTILGLLAPGIALVHLLLVQASRIVTLPAWNDARTLISLSSSADRISQLTALRRMDRR